MGFIFTTSTLLACLVASCFCIPSGKSSIGYFWQVTDFHYDQDYRQSGDPSKMCHISDTIAGALGIYGDFHCDSPWSLILSAIEAMFKHCSKPDFILWTGDTAPHIPDTMSSEGNVLHLLGNLSSALRQVFPNALIYPSFGNHDSYPSGEMPYTNTSFYRKVLDISGWKTVIPDESLQTFQIGGYYSHSYSPKLRIILLNTVLYYQFNDVVVGVADPSDQFAWLEKELTLARHNNEQVYIAAHVPPGFSETAMNANFFHDSFNARYMDILVSFMDVIAGQFYGHAHTDSFRVTSVNGQPKAGAFLSPSVTPFLGGVVGKNPAIRLYAYDRNTMTVTDYVQYYFNLTAANGASSTVEWQKEYSFTEAYGVPDASGGSLFSIWHSFLNGSSPSFASYFAYNGVGLTQASDVSASCNAACIAGQICAVRYIDFAAYKLCLDDFNRKTTPRPALSSTTHHHPHKDPAPRYMHYIIAGLAGMSIVLAIGIAIYCFRKRKLNAAGNPPASSRSAYEYQPLP